LLHKFLPFLKVKNDSIVPAVREKYFDKNITSISYNSLNLPGVVTFSDGNTVTYGYDASGSKLSVAYTVGGSTVKTEYAGNKVYKNGTLSMILTEEGYITLSGTTPTYHYYLRDHQGNNRVVIDQAGTVLQVNHYYPFGGLFGEGVQTSSQPYRYNGKELDRQLELDLYDYGARHYDATLGRWLTVDPLAEKYYGISPYAYCANNPVNMIDPNGMWSDWVEDRQKRIYWDEQATSQATTALGEAYIGRTVYATDQNGSFRYGDQFGNWHDSAPLGEVSVTGFQTSGSGAVSSAIRGAAGGYDPQWIVGFNKFVEAGLKAINLTLTATTLAADAGSLGGGSRVRAVLNSVDDVAKGGIQLTKKTFGHTFTTHGDDMTNFLINRAKGSGMAQGQFLNNQKAAQFILDNVGKTANGAVNIPINIPIPKGFPARVIMPDGTFKAATHIRLIPGGSGVKTAYPLIP
jgi:RHS repeat-associated protein